MKVKFVGCSSSLYSDSENLHTPAEALKYARDTIQDVRDTVENRYASLSWLYEIQDHPLTQLERCGTLKGTRLG